jgi:hypothetical protein
MQIESVDTKAGVAICCALSNTTRPSPSGSASRLVIDVLDLDGRIIHQDADRQS